VEITAVNETDDPARLHVWRISDGATYEQFAPHIDEERQRALVGEEPVGAVTSTWTV